MSQDTAAVCKDQRRPAYLVGRNTGYLRSQIGGCPHAQTCTAWSDTYQWHVLISLPCRRWGCSHCGKVRTAQLARDIERAQPNRFVTLTTDQKLWPDGRAAYDGVRRKLPDFTKAIRKHIGSYEYVRILELHRNGMPHWHMLVRSPYIPQKLLSETWAAYTGSVIVDVRMIKRHVNVWRYVAKYLTKATYIPWTNRRVAWSKKFFPPREPHEKTDWKLSLKVHHLEPPERIMEQEWYGWRAVRIGDYAWTFEQVDPVVPTAPSLQQ